MKLAQKICKIVPTVKGKEVYVLPNGKGFVCGDRMKVRFKTDIEQGLYSKEFLEKGILESLPMVAYYFHEMIDMNKFERTGTLSEKQLGKLKKAFNFVGKDDLRPVMKGVYCGEKSLCATDAHMMCFYNEPTGFKEPIIINENTNKILKLAKSEVNVYYPKNRKEINSVIFECNEFTLESYVIDGKYHNWQAVLPLHDEVSETTVTFDNVQMQNVLNILKEYTGTHRKIKMCFEVNKVKITGEDEDRDIRRTEAINCLSFFGATNENKSNLTIGFNVIFLLKCLKNLDKGEVTMKMTYPHRAVILNNEILIMPVMLP